MIASALVRSTLGAGVAILITGLGYIGARLALDLLQQGERVVGLENFFCTPRPALSELAQQPGLRLVRGSINRAATLRRVFGLEPVEAVVHLAAQPSAHPAAARPSYTELTNLVGPRLLLEAAQQAGVRRVVLGSSFKVYGDRLPERVTEHQPYGRVGDLAHLSKIYVEKLAEMLAAAGGPPAVAVRLGITYGLGPVMKHDPRFMTVPNLFARLAAERKPLTIHPGATEPAGFIHLADASAALQAALAADWNAPYRAVNAVTECATVGQVAGWVQRAARAHGLEARVAGGQDAPARRVAVETSLPGFEARAARRLADSLGEVVAYFLQAGRPADEPEPS
jgi:nucleoside-diphosphate-sugar epimerase